MSSAMDPPGKLFINYRRTDADAWADRLFEKLTPEFGEENIFFDIGGGIPAGFNWQEWIDKRVTSSDLMLVLIGPHWGDEFARRSDPASIDYVRLEIERALLREIPIVPVLLGGASLPSREALPEKLRSVLDRQALSLGRSDQFATDVETLIGAVLSSVRLWRTQKAQRPADSQPSLAMLRLERELRSAGMPAVDAESTRIALGNYSNYLERGGAAGVHGLAPKYELAPDFADQVDTQKAISALNGWLNEVDREGDAQFGYIDMGAKLSSSWVFVDWKGDVIADRDSGIPTRILRPPIFTTTGSGLVCHTPGKVLAVERGNVVNKLGSKSVDS